MVGVCRLLDVVIQLRDPNCGCPWDRRQTFHTITPYTVEEAYEVADAIVREQWDELPDELGDLLFQVVFLAQIASERNLFDFDDVVKAIVDKMIRRHPHVFGGSVAADETSQNVAWEAHKIAERAERVKDSSSIDSVTTGLPSLKRADKLQRRAAMVGFDWDSVEEVIPKVLEELQELRDAVNSRESEESVFREMGDLLFTCVNLARHLDIDADAALRSANVKFEMRFRHMELEAKRRGQIVEKLTASEMDDLWEESKQHSPL